MLTADPSLDHLAGTYADAIRADAIAAGAGEHEAAARWARAFELERARLAAEQVEFEDDRYQLLRTT